MKKQSLIALSPQDLLRVRRWISQLKGRRILVLGDVGVDRYTLGRVERISPEAPVPIVAVEQEEHKLGLAANVADNVHALGSRAEMLGVVGRDAPAHLLKALLKHAGMSVRGLVTDVDRRTILKERVVSDRQQLLRIDYESVGDVSPTTRREILKRARKLIAGVDLVIIEDYAKGLLSQELMRDVVRLAKAKKIRILLDPNSKTDPGFYRGVTGLTPNTREAEALSGIALGAGADILKRVERAGQVILEKTGAEFVLITRGKDGMALVERGSAGMRSIPTTAREVYDVSGAGDTVIAVLALALSAGAELLDAAILANVAAGVEVGKRGTATVSATEIEQALDRL